MLYTYIKRDMSHVMANIYDRIERDTFPHRARHFSASSATLFRIGANAYDCIKYDTFPCYGYITHTFTKYDTFPRI